MAELEIAGLAGDVDLTLGQGAPPKRVIPDLAGARILNDSEAQAMKLRRERIHQKFSEAEEAAQAPAWGDGANDGWGDTSPFGDLNPAEAVIPVVDENLESVEVGIPPNPFQPKGATVLFGPPAGVSMTMRILQLLGTRQVNQNTIGVLKVLLSVRRIDDWQAPAITNLMDAQRMANKIGDTALDILSMTYVQCWPTIQIDQLPILKKNQRV